MNPLRKIFFCSSLPLIPLNGKPNCFENQLMMSEISPLGVRGKEKNTFWSGINY
jgi:hypothetical protein